MAEYFPPSTVPNPSLQDAVIMQFACGTPSRTFTKPTRNCPSNLGSPLLSKPDGSSVFEQAWASQPEFLPVVLEAGETRAEGGPNAQEGYWAKRRGKSQSTALAYFLDEMRFRFPAGTKAGRIAAIGFSEGCNGIKGLLSDPRDAESIDFVYACDGLAGNVNPTTNEFSLPSIEPWINFAVMAAHGRKMMVVTHTEIVPENRKKDGIASTTEGASALLQEVKRRIGYTGSSARTVPRALIGQNGFAPKPPNGEYWPGHSNTSQADVRIPGPWPVKYYSILGNLIVVGFAAQEQDLMGLPTNTPAASRDSAHIFQAGWVMQQVVREALACRWAAKCDTVNINSEGGDAAAGLGQAAQFQSLRYVDPRFPSVIQQPHPKMTRMLKAVGGLGAVGPGCIVEGKFSGIEWGRSGYSPSLAAGSLLTPENLLFATGAAVLGYAGWKLYNS